MRSEVIQNSFGHSKVVLPSGIVGTVLPRWDVSTSITILKVNLSLLSVIIIWHKYVYTSLLVCHSYFRFSKAGLPWVQQCMLYLYPQLLQLRGVHVRNHLYTYKSGSNIRFTLYNLIKIWTTSKFNEKCVSNWKMITYWYGRWTQTYGYLTFREVVTNLLKKNL